MEMAEISRIRPTSAALRALTHRAFAVSGRHAFAPAGSFV
jgi:hypothetical protein